MKPENVKTAKEYCLTGYDIVKRFNPLNSAVCYKYAD